LWRRPFSFLTRHPAQTHKHTPFSQTVVEERKLVRPRLTNTARVFSQPNLVLTHHKGLGKGPNLEADVVTKPGVRGGALS
jgi:hypothetical protein